MPRFDLPFLAVIPARAGSKRLPGKNVRPLAGKSLVQRAIEAAQGANLPEILVSSDHPEILKLAEQFNLKTNGARPAELAQDTTGIAETLKYEINTFENRERISVQNVILLQPTSPLRTSGHLLEAMQRFLSSRADTLTSVIQPSQHPYYTLTLAESGLKPLFGSEKFNTERSKLPAAFVETGLVYIFKRTLLKNDTIYGDRIEPFLIEQNLALDIDTLEDFQKAEQILNVQPLSH